jgi:hypothetical protein
LGGIYLLAPGDALFFPNGVAEASRSSDDSELILLRMALAPAIAPPGGTPVAPSRIVVIAPAPPAATPGQASTPGVSIAIEAGAIVVVTTDGLRLRDAPSTSGNVLASLAAGQQLQVTGPPVPGSANTWLPVIDPITGLQGYVAADFVEVLDQ